MKSVRGITIISFGFRFGYPSANYIFDVGFLKNPARQSGWSLQSPIDDEMKQFILNQKELRSFLDGLIPLIATIKDYDDDVRMAFGCSSGRHRSPIVAEEVARQLNVLGLSSTIIHREYSFVR